VFCVVSELRKFDFRHVINEIPNKWWPVVRRSCSDTSWCFWQDLFSTLPSSRLLRENTDVVWRSTVFSWQRYSTFWSLRLLVLSGKGQTDTTYAHHETMTSSLSLHRAFWNLFNFHPPSNAVIQGESLARGPKLLSIKNYVIEIMTWNFIYIYRERYKTGLAHNRCWNWSPFTSKHTWMRFFKFWNTLPKVSTLTAWISWRIASLSCSIVRGCIFVHFALH